MASGGGSEKPPHDQAPVFNTYKGLSTSHLSKKRRINRHHFFDPPNEVEGMPFLRVSGTQMLISMGKMVFFALFIEFLLTLLCFSLRNSRSILVPVYAVFFKTPHE